jgi:hypothetical protein
MLFETKNGSISILYGRQCHDPLHTHTQASINNAESFQVGPNSAVPEIILETWSKERHLGKMECENLPVSSTFQLFCHSSNIICFATGSKSRATDCALYTILPEIACFASKSALSFPAIPPCACAHMKITSRPFRASCLHFCLHSYTNHCPYQAHTVGQDTVCYAGISRTHMLLLEHIQYRALRVLMGLMGSTSNNSLDSEKNPIIFQ